MSVLVTLHTSSLQISSVTAGTFEKSPFFTTGYNQPLVWGEPVWDWGTGKVRAQNHLAKAQWVGKR